MRRWPKTFLSGIIIIAHFIFSPLFAQQSLTQIDGWNAYVHLPANYYSSGLSYPTIIFFPGIGEIGTNALSVIAYGPGAYINQGWNGNVTIDATLVEFIVISLQTPTGFPNEFSINQRIQTIKSLYRVNPNKLYLTGLSHGGWCSSTFVTGDAYGGPYNYASQIAAVVTVEGMIPDDNQPYPNLFDNFALSGGKYLGFEQLLDGRDTRTVVDRMNLTVPNSAIYIPTNFGGGGHCCWSQFYGGEGLQPGIFLLGGINQNLYQWLARQSLSANTNLPPVANAGLDINITLPTNSASLNGSGSDADGTIISYLWNQIAGPSAATIMSSNNPITTVSGLIQGQYKFSLKVTDNNGITASDTMLLFVNSNATTNICNANLPVTYYLASTQPGEIYRPNGNLWKGGDTIKITGTNYSVIEFYNIAGDPCRPLVIMPMTTLVTPTFRFKGNCRYIKLWGGTTPYGIKISGGPLAISSSHHIEADNIECSGGSIGIYCKQDVVYSDTMTWHPNYRMTKFTFKNMWIHDINGEGMYIGITQPDGLTVRSTYSGLDTVIIPVRLDSVEISNCIVERTTWDAIQLSNARDGNKIFNNTVRNYGTYNISSQQAGIILGGNCNGDVYGNTITKGTGNGIQVFGYGLINIYNNTLDSCGYNGAINANGSEGQQSVYASDYVITTDNNPKQTMNVFGNSINHPKSSGGVFITGYFNNSFPSSVYNNSFCIPNAPVNWQSVYIKSYVPGSTAVNNILSCAVSTNIAPTANAGNNINLTLPVNSTTLSGSGTDPDGTIASHNWSLVSGPAGSTIISSNAAVASISNLVQGVFFYQLMVTDNGGAIGRDTVMVTVNPVANQAPVANAGYDMSITLPVNSITLSGSGTDADGTIISYQWLKIVGPATATLTNANTQTPTAGNLIQSIYSYQLTVMDNSGAVGRDTVMITVIGANNQLPIANAGNNISITLPVNYTNLFGSGTDPDGSIVSYTWTLLSGPAGSTIISSDAPVAAISNLQQGIYNYQLSVIDNAGAIARDTVEVIVNAAINQLPSANAGNNISITLPVNTTNLSGSGTDPDGIIVSYAWIKVSGPATGILTNSNTPTPTAINLVQGTYSFELTVTDNSGAVDKDTVEVTVNAAINILPIANAGNDINLTLPVNTTSLNGSGLDPDGTIISYAWTKISGPVSGSIIISNIALTTVINLTQGVYQFQLTVTDNSGAIGKDTVIVTVNAAGNLSPIANAGIDITLTLPLNNTQLNGSGTDPDGSIVSYSWLKIAGPAAGILNNANSPVATLTNLIQGVYIYQFIITDNSGAVGRDTIFVTVNSAGNMLPVANAGNDINITLPVNFTSLSGTGTDADGTIVSYFWSLVSGPAGSTITSSDAAIASIGNLVQGTYSYQLTVTDNTGDIGRDTVNVTVNAAINIPPTAHAGNDINITLPENTTTLSGSATDPDGTIVSYNWILISGPAGSSIISSNAPVAMVGNLVQGSYTYQLTVTDNDGALARDTVNVYVYAAINIPPTAHAGNNISLTLPVNTTVLSGSGADPDGIIVSYAWVKIAGPVTGTLTNANTATPTAGSLVQGVYSYQLTVTDNSGATSRDTVNVSVNAAINIPPTAHAGNNISLTLPVNTTTLSGSGTDPDGTIFSYNWILISGPAGSSIISSNAPFATINNLVQGLYSYQLTVTDNSGAIGRDTVNVSVNAAINIPPTAHAGNNISLTLPVNTTVLSGSGTDPDGSIVSYTWVKLAGPATGTLTNANTATPTAGSLVQGVYSYQLTVTDNAGALARDTVNVTVNAAINIPPTAHAGNNISLTLPVNTTVLSGSGTDPDGTIVSYAWVKIAGPVTGTLTNANTATPTAGSLVQGVYSYQLTVTDNAGALARDTVNVTVNAAINIPPTAHAGNDLTIYLPMDSINLNGTGTDVNGFIVAYHWRVISTSAQYSFTNVTTAQTQLNNLAQGIYLVEFSVTDNDGAKGYDTLTVTVGISRQTITKEQVNIYPNPVTSILNAEIKSPKNDKAITLILLDSKGAKVYQKILTLSGNTKIEKIDMTKFKSGIYLLQVNYGNNKQVVKKLVKL